MEEGLLVLMYLDIDIEALKYQSQSVDLVTENPVMAPLEPHGWYPDSPRHVRFAPESTRLSIATFKCQ